MHIICFDHSKEKIQLDKVNVYYVQYSKSKINNIKKLNKQISKIIDTKSIDIIIIRFYIFCLLTKFLNNKKNIRWYLDIRTGSVSTSNIKRFLYNKIIKLTSFFFENITIISYSLAEKLKIRKYTVLPVGSNCLVDFSKVKNHFSDLNFLYVGIFDGRKIEDIINSFIRFYNEFSNVANLKLDIVGYSNNALITSKINKLIEDNSNINIKYHGRVPNYKLGYFFNQSNIGISYIPITSWFDVQPPTKTIEYVVNGMFCIATGTTENKKIITKTNGIIIRDNEESLYNSMVYILYNYKKFNRFNIAMDAKNLTWDKIYEEILYPILKQNIN